MNDFTKEELEQLKRSVAYHWNEIGEYATDEKRKEFILIKQKLKVLIEDYCEHKHKIECADCEVLRCRYCIKAERK